MRKVFISYAQSRNDAEFAKQLSTALQRRIDVVGYLDRADLSYTKPEPSFVRQSIRSADAMIVLLSQKTRESIMVLFEVGAAQALEKIILPVLLPGATKQDSLPEVLPEIFLDARDEPTEIFLDARNIPIREVAERIESSLEVAN
jgi:TIR domain